VDVAGQHLAYRSRQSTGSYFRLMVECERCHVLSVRRSVRIRSCQDLAAAVELAARFGSAEHCPEPADGAHRVLDLTALERISL
jgi:hypothetical protein